MTRGLSEKAQDGMLEEAALHVLRAKSGEAREMQALSAWIGSDLSRRQAAEQVETAWADSDELNSDPRLEAMRREAHAMIDDRHPHRRVPAWIIRHPVSALAASVCLFLACTTAFIGRPHKDGEMVVENEGLSVRQVRLTDGSVALLDVGTKIAVDMSAAKRLVRLEAGQARFAVAHDPGRPFHVVAGDRDVRAVGTQFTVDAGTRRTIVVSLIQGTVDVARIVPRFEWLGLRQAADLKSPVRMRAGQQLLATMGRPQQLRPFDLTEITAWERGMVILNQRTLVEAADAINRQSPIPVRIDSTVPRDLTISGSFKAGDSVAFADNLILLYPQLAVVGQRDLHVIMRPMGEISSSR